MIESLVELYFDDNYEHFCRGVYYDQECVAHSLVGEFRMGMFTDTYSIFYGEKERQKRPLLRYYMGADYVEFYESNFADPESTRIIIHNIGEQELKVAFQYGEVLWKLEPGEQKEIKRFN